MNTFSSISLKERDTYYSYWAKTPTHSLDYTLPNIWGWQRYFGLSWLHTNDLAWIRQEKPEPLFWAPLGAWESVDWAVAMDNVCKGQKTFIRVPETLLSIWQSAIPERLTVFEDRGQWEYLYGQNDLSVLPGKTFHKKKNHYSGFVKEFGEPDYHPIDNSIVEDVLALQDEWCQWHECADSTSLQAENEAINQVLSHWQYFSGMCGGAIYIDGKIAAFSIGEKLDEQSLGVHYEKGLLGYKGIYQAINKCFAEHAGEGFSVLNRAQDLDEEGLRKAKMSYHPVGFLKKYRVLVD